MWEDPIVEEARKAREVHAAQFAYELHAIFKALKEEEAASGRQYISLPPKRTKKAQADHIA